MVYTSYGCYFTTYEIDDRYFIHHRGQISAEENRMRIIHSYTRTRDFVGNLFFFELDGRPFVAELIAIVYSTYLYIGTNYVVTQQSAE